MRAPIKTVTVDDFSPYRIAQFWSNMRLTPNGCMEFQGSERVKGYGVVEMVGRTARSHRRCLSHRAAYAMTWGECPGDKHVLHSCDNPRCINPIHLELGSHTDNMRDMVAKGRHWRTQRRNST